MSSADLARAVADLNNRPIHWDCPRCWYGIIPVTDWTGDTNQWCDCVDRRVAPPPAGLLERILDNLGTRQDTT